MAIKIGKKLREVSTTERVFKKEQEMLLSVMSSGIKLRKALASALGVVTGENVWYAEDEDSGKVYLFKTSESDEFRSRLSKTLSFHNKGFEDACLRLAKEEDATIEYTTGDVIDFSVSETPEEGSYFELTFKEFNKAAEKEVEDADSDIDVAPVTNTIASKSSKKAISVEDDI